MRRLAFAAVLAFAPVPAAVADTPLERAEAALRNDNNEAAREAAKAAAAADPKNPAGFAALGLACQNLRDNAGAAGAFGTLAKLDPQSVFAHDRLGDALLKLGRFADAVAAFDAALALRPALAPEHWRRGIALYYAGRFADGAKQFEVHKTANPEDVENAAWHYLCNARVVGRDKARKELIAVTRDRRVPMKEIQRLFAGTATPADVLAAADAVEAGTAGGTEARFYAHLYVGLWHEAEGDAAKAKEHLTAAAEKYKIGHYMWDVANAHVEALKKPAK